MTSNAQVTVNEKDDSQMDIDSAELANNNASGEIKVSSSPTNSGKYNDNQFFYEDEIFRIDKKGRVRFGLIIETPLDNYSGDEDDTFDDTLNTGEVRVVWYPGGRENVHLEKNIALADRTLMPGDVVRRLVVGKDTQIGYCSEINMCADVKVLGRKYVIKNVMAERFRLISNWPSDNPVCLDSWVGSVKEREEKAVLRSCYGSRFEISSNDFYAFRDASSRQMHTQVFYPGNVVIGHVPSIASVKLLTPNVPIRTNKKGKPLTEKYTIEKVYTDAVWVHWQCKALSEEPNMQTAAILEQPNACVTGDDLKRLKRLNIFESCTLQINDRTYLTFSQYDTVLKKSVWDKEQNKKYKSILNEQKKEDNRNSYVQSCGTNINLNTHNNFEKFKKKMNNLDGETKSAAKSTKKYLLKMEKLNQSLSKEKSQINENLIDKNTTTSLNNKSPLAKNSDTDWVTDDEDDDDKSTTSTISTGSSPSRGSANHSTRRDLKKKTKKRSTKTSSAEFAPKDGDELVTEALLVYSTATVVWQDGTIEKSIKSTQLYPIHHLDNHEFFPGDFVTSGKEDSDMSFRDYGVIQTVDHNGRTAHVKWFTTYTSTEEPKPTYKGESEVSVYDIKDHSDFQYRPGTMVIRVANFVGADATCTAGQIINNYIDGHVKVWWVDGHISMCWPQDLFEVGPYNREDWEQESDDSWETESENSELGGESPPKLSLEDSNVITNMERAVELIARLEEIFNRCPNLLDPEVMRKLLTVFKGCRYLDRLLNTNFFHEENFKGLIERKAGTQTLSERVQDRKNRLFSYVPASSSVQQQQQQQCHYQAIVAVNTAQSKTNTTASNNLAKEYCPKVLFNLCSTPFKCTPSSSSLVVNSNGAISNSCPPSACKRKCTPITAAKTDNANEKSVEKSSESLYNVLPTQSLSKITKLSQDHSVSDASTTLDKTDPYNNEKNQLLNSAMWNIEKAFERTHQLKAAKNTHSQDDSGNYSRNENCDGSYNSYASSSDLTNIDVNSSLIKINDDQKSISSSSIEIPKDAAPEIVCVRLCSLLKDQLGKCINEIRSKFVKEEEAPGKIVDIAEQTNTTTVIDTENAKENATTSAENACSILSDARTVTSSPTSSCIVDKGCFEVLPFAPKSHKFYSTNFHPNNPQQYYRAVQREHRMLKNSLPLGVWVRVFEDRVDLVSVMMEGPMKTPYENGIFFFDIQLGSEYPKNPPLCHYISFCSDRLNPNLYEDGKVCVSLLGTWTGRDSEVWNSSSTLLQVIVSIQGLILVPEPYFNEAGYEKQKGTQQGQENSRMYNEMVIIKLVQATTRMLTHSPEIFINEFVEYYHDSGKFMYDRIKGWIDLSQAMSNVGDRNAPNEQPLLNKDEIYQCSYPEFPLLPASRGFCLTLTGILETFRSKLYDVYDFNARSDTSNASIISNE